MITGNPIRMTFRIPLSRLKNDEAFSQHWKNGGADATNEKYRGQAPKSFRRPWLDEQLVLGAAKTQPQPWLRPVLSDATMVTEMHGFDPNDKVLAAMLDETG